MFIEIFHKSKYSYVSWILFTKVSIRGKAVVSIQVGLSGTPFHKHVFRWIVYIGTLISLACKRMQWTL